MAGALVPEDDLYARLEVAVDASPEAIELAWRALLKQHHPDVAGDDARRPRARQADQRRPRLAERPVPARPLRPRAPGPRRDPAPAARGPASGTGGRRAPGRRSRRPARPPRGPAGPRGPDLVRGEPARAPRTVPRPRRAAVRRRARPPRRRRAAADRVPGDRPAVRHPRRRGRVRGGRGRSSRPASRASAGPRSGLREGLLGVAAELVLSRVPRRHARGAVPRPRARPAAAGVGGVDRPAALRPERRRGARRPRAGPRLMTPRRGRRARPRLRRRARRRPAVAAGARPRRGRGAPDLRAARGPRRGAALPVGRPGPGDRGARPAAAARASGHVTALRHAFTAAMFTELTAPFVAATRPSAAERPADAPGVRRAR